MKPLLDTILFLAWVSVYLTAVFWIGRYRRGRVHSLGPSGRCEYRADKDVGLWLLVFVLGIVLFFAAYLLTSMIGQFPQS